MGKKWKKKLQRQNQGLSEEDIQLDFPEVNKGSNRVGVFKKGLSKQQKKKQKGFQKALARGADDVDMGGGISFGKNRSKDSGPTLSSGWHRVALPGATRYSKETVLQALANALSLRSLTLEPIAFKLQGPHYSFHVESPACAAALKALDKQINLSPNDAFVLRINVNTSPAPQMIMNDQAVASMKQVMSARFNSITGHLDLSHFHNDSAFLGHDIYVPLSRGSVMSNVIKIINENVPQVSSIDLSKNKLPTLDYFSTLVTPNLKSINLDDNRLEVRQLEKVSALKLVELSIKGNPLMRDCDTNEDKLSEVTDKIRDVLPTLKILNGVVLPKKISFEDDANEVFSSLPKSIKKCATNDHSVNEIVLHFLREYFSIYDSDNREGLLQAYHEEAKFSMSAAYPPGCSAHGVSKLQEYQLEARNLKLITKKQKRDKLLKQDRLSIVAFLTNLPRTKHNLDSFTLDIPFASAALITFTVTGFFQERGSSTTSPAPMRYFNRMFVVAPSNGTVTILNDILFVTIPTQEQIRDLEAPPLIQPQTEVPAVHSIAELTDLVNRLCQATRMNQIWSRKCLEETHWNYSTALAAFQTAFQQSQIPPEAFV